MLFQLLFLLIAACSAQALPAGSPKKPGMPGVTPSSKMADFSVLSKLRQEMVSWYCPDGAHADEPPCKVYSFLQKLKVRTPPPRRLPILAPRLLPPPFLTAHRAATATGGEGPREEEGDAERAPGGAEGGDAGGEGGAGPVSYTHLTLPTILLV